MIVSETQARTKACPIARAPSGTSSATVAVNRDTAGKQLSSCRCIASDCMWWQIAPTVPQTTPGAGYCGAIRIMATLFNG